MQFRLTVNLDFRAGVSRTSGLILRNVNASDPIGKLLTQLQVFPGPRIVLEDATQNLEDVSIFL